MGNRYNKYTMIKPIMENSAKYSKGKWPLPGALFNEKLLPKTQLRSSISRQLMLGIFAQHHSSMSTKKKKLRILCFSSLVT